MGDPPSVTLAPPGPTVGVEPGEVLAISARATGSEPQVSWSANCLKDEICQVLRHSTGADNFFTAPQLPGEQVTVRVTVTDRHGREDSAALTFRVKDTSAIASPTTTARPAVPPTPLPTPVDVTIDSPEEGEVVACLARVQGTLSTTLSPGANLWLVMLPGGTGTWHVAPGLVNEGQSWWVDAYIGLCTEDDPAGKDVGRSFQLYIGIADAEADRAFRRYLAESSRQNDFPGMFSLPAGYAPVDRVGVQRR
jgi:hypothetical protein